MLEEFNKIKLPSNEKFGNFFTIVFLILSIYFYFINSSNLFIFFLSMSFIMVFIRFLIPSILIYPNKAWMFFGLLLNKIISPLILGIIFYIILIVRG